MKHRKIMNNILKDMKNKHRNNILKLKIQRKFVIVVTMWLVLSTFLCSIYLTYYNRQTWSTNVMQLDPSFVVPLSGANAGSQKGYRPLLLSKCPTFKILEILKEIVKYGVPLQLHESGGVCKQMLTFAVCLGNYNFTSGLIARLRSHNLIVETYVFSNVFDYGRIKWDELKEPRINAEIYTRSVLGAVNSSSALSHLAISTPQGGSVYLVNLVPVVAKYSTKDVDAYIGLPFPVEVNTASNVVELPILIDSTLVTEIAMDFLEFVVHDGETIARAYRHLSWSHYVSCGQGSVNASGAQMTLATPKIPKWFRSTQQNNAKYALRFHKELRILGILPGLEGGNMLGWHRQCAVISYDRDLDFAVFSEDATDDMFKHIATGRGPDTGRQLDVKSTDRGEPSPNLYKLGDFFYPWRRFGPPNRKLLEISFVQPDEYQRIDLIMITRYNATHSGIPQTVHEDHNVFYCLHETLKKCTGAFFGAAWAVYCDPTPALMALYGKNWRKPSFKYGYCMSRQYVKKHYTNSEWEEKQMFEEFWIA